MSLLGRVRITGTYHQARHSAWILRLKLGSLELSHLPQFPEVNFRAAKHSKERWVALGDKHRMSHYRVHRGPRTT